MTIDSKLHDGVKNPRVSSRYQDILRLEVLPVMDARAESDFARSSSTSSNDEDIAVLWHYTQLGGVKASGIYTYNDERVGTFFYSVFGDSSTGKTLLVVGIGADWKDGESPVYSRLMDAVLSLAKDEGCRWIKAGSTRSGVIRMLLECGMTPVRVDFCMEVK